MGLSESINDALVECVKACGGSGVVGPKLWPEKAPLAAQRLLLDCLSEERPAKLSPEQIMFVLRLARSRGCHAGIEFVCADLGYTQPQPIEPEDERAKLQREYVEAARLMAKLAERIERTAGSALRAAA